MINTLTAKRPLTQQKSRAAETNRPLRLLIATPRYFPYMGGVQNHVYQVSRRLQQQNVDVTILTTNPEGHLPAEDSYAGVALRRMPAYPAQRDYYFAPGMYRFITQGNWDVVHIQSYHTLVAPMAMFAAWRANIPYIVTFHGGGHSSSVRNLLRHVQRRMLGPLLHRATRLIATARFEVGFFGDMLNLPAEKFTYIPNGADLLATGDQHLITDPNFIVSIGRLEKYKGHHRVLASLPHVLKERPDTRLWIAGSGPYEAALRQQAADLGVADRVEISVVPVAEREKLAQRLSQAAVVCLLSEYETHPMAALEAIALKRAVLVADTSGLSELAENGWATAIPLHSSPQETAVSLLNQLQNPRTPPDFNLPTWDDCTRDLLALYQGVAT